MLVGYARVSTMEQETRLQLDAFGDAGVSVVYQDKSSSVGRRPQLRRALRALKPGDTLVVWKLDRLARSLKDLLEILETLELSRCSFRSLTEPIDTSTPLGTFVLQILGAVAQLERSMIRERSIAGQVSAYKRGVRWGGRSPSLDKKKAAEVKRLRSKGWTHEALAQRHGVSRSTISRVLNPKSSTDYRPLPVLSRYL